MLRAFANLPTRQVHYRHGGAGQVPLLMLHASPGSAKQLERLAEALERHRRVVASDRPGNGDTPPLPIAAPTIGDYAIAELEFLDAIGVETFDVFGMHTGAWVAVELAIRAPSRVRRVILDGFGLFSPDEAAAYLEHYAPAIQPDRAGLHLHWAFQFCRDQALFFPWFNPTTANARGLGLPSAQSLHDTTLEVLKSINTYHLAYRASFRYDAARRLPLVRQDVLAISAADDPLYCHLEEALRLLPRAATGLAGSLRAPDAATTLASLIANFLDQDA